MRALRVLVFVVLAGGLAFSGWLYLNAWQLPWGKIKPEGELPVIEALPNPIKERPDDPGGYQLKNLGVQILESAGRKEPEGPVRLLPRPEEPRPRPDREAVSKAVSVAIPPETTGTPASIPVADEEAMDPAQPTQARTSPKEAEQVPPPEREVPTGEGMPVPTASEAKTLAETPGEASAPEAESPPPAGIVETWIQLASFRDRSAAEQEWMRLRKKHPEILEPLRRRIEEVKMDDERILYRLRAGPFPGATRAKAICDAFKATGTDCFVMAQR